MVVLDFDMQDERQAIDQSGLGAQVGAALLDHCGDSTWMTGNPNRSVAKSRTSALKMCLERMSLSPMGKAVCHPFEGSG